MNGPTNIWWFTGPNARGNPVVQCKNQEREDPRLAAESRLRVEQERLARRAPRLAEGGRCGGLFDRQDTTERRTWEDDDSEFDDFGRRRGKSRVQGVAPELAGRPVGQVLSKEERRQAALERLRQKQLGSGAKASSNAPGANTSASSMCEAGAVHGHAADTDTGLATASVAVVASTSSTEAYVAEGGGCPKAMVARSRSRSRSRNHQCELDPT